MIRRFHNHSWRMIGWLVKKKLLDVEWIGDVGQEFNMWYCVATILVSRRRHQRFCIGLSTCAHKHSVFKMSNLVVARYSSTSPVLETTCCASVPNDDSLWLAADGTIFRYKWSSCYLFICNQNVGGRFGGGACNVAQFLLLFYSSFG